MTASQRTIRVRNARAHNLKGIDLELPHGRLIVVTGVSGSGKSSLAFDTLYREGSRRYLETFSTFARQHLGKLERPPVDGVEGLPPVIAVSQLTHGAGPRSTVGTLSEIGDLLRLLYARTGLLRCAQCGSETLPPHPSSCPECCADLPRVDRSLFSFNTPRGACPACNGLGTEDAVDPDLLVADPAKSLRKGALVPTLPRGYIIYSQVTMEVLDQVCNAHGFTVDQPWNTLTEEQQKVVFYGSERLKVPYGKHTLESRLRWTGLTAKPREEGYYKGIIPVIEETLKRNRNANILRFVRTRRCRACDGSRLGTEALQVTVGGQSIAALNRLHLDALATAFESVDWPAQTGAVASPILRRLDERLTLLRELGLGYLALDRETTSLAPGERQRIRLATQALGGLRGVLYVLDEPSVGLHPADVRRLLDLLFRLRDQGNTVLVVEHDPAVIAAADWLVELGPGAGPHGGEVLFSAPNRRQPELPPSSPCHPERAQRVEGPLRPTPTPTLTLLAPTLHNLRGDNATFRLGGLNAVTGVSGAGKASLVFGTLVPALLRRLGGGESPGPNRGFEGPVETIRRLVVVDNAPIGRTPRSNAATYTKLWDAVRKRFAETPEAVARGFDAGRFSFNTKGGRCETCEGAGVQQLGMFFLGDVEVPCPDCGGRRFLPETLAIPWKGRSVADLLELSVDEALELLGDEPAIGEILQALHDVGLGYVPLGQPSTTLSGGEAQRVKLATELARPSKHHTLYVLAEPTTGLHERDVERLLAVLRRLVESGHTVLAVEHDLQLLAAADHLVDLGPGSGDQGGRIVAQGPPEAVAECAESLTGTYLRPHTRKESKSVPQAGRTAPNITLAGVRTHNLKGIDVTIPVDSFTVITGPSGSGKSSLAFDTLYAEGQRRFAEGLSAYARRTLQRLPRPDLATAEGLSPPVAVHQRSISGNPRSTVATVTELHDHFRLLWSRAGTPHCPECLLPLGDGGCLPLGDGGCPRCDFRLAGPLSAGHFSFNRQEGACPDCGGLGLVLSADPERLVTHPERSLLDGAMDGHKTGRFYGDAGNRFVHILRAAGETLELDFSRPWSELSPEARRVAMYGAGREEFEATWEFDRGGRKGSHTWTSAWPGFVHYVDEEYQRKHGDKRGDAMRPLLGEMDCPSCDGERLRPPARAVRLGGRRLPEVEGLSVTQALDFFEETPPPSLSSAAAAAWGQVVPAVRQRLETLDRLGLGYLGLDRRTPTLSGGEARRVRLATQLGGRLFGVTYVLDEPTIGLHPRDTEQLLGVLRQLRDEGNTVVAVEHDPAIVQAADWLIRLGPGGGTEGGYLLDQGSGGGGAMPPSEPHGGPPFDRFRAGSSPTWGRDDIRSEDGSAGMLTVVRAVRHNLRGIDVSFRLGALNVVTGVSGSGKSTLVFEVLEPTLRTGRPVGCDAVEVPAPFAAIRTLDATPIGRTPASTPATFLGILDVLRKRFADLPDARSRKLSASHFSYVHAKGRCPECKGTGAHQVAMDFMADVWIPCEGCGGRRYRPEVLEARLDGRSIADLLDLTVAEAAPLFATDKALAGPLSMLVDLGLGYLPLGQPATTLSGGEAQRLKLAAELARPSAKGSMLFLLDEPTRGLGEGDVTRLLQVLSVLVSAGHTAIVVEHNVQVMRAAHHLVDLGPEGGDGGGLLVASGTPAEVAATASHTGRALRPAAKVDV